MGTGVGEAAVMGAIMGGGTAALTGGDPLKGAMIGGLTGGVGGGIAGAAPGAAPMAATGTASQGLGAFAQNPSVAMLPASEAIGFGAAQPALGSGLASLTSDAGIMQGLSGATSPSLMADPLAYLKANKGIAGASGLAGGLFGRAEQQAPPGMAPYQGPLSRFRFNPDTYQPLRMAEGGIASLGVQPRMSGVDPRMNAEPMGIKVPSVPSVPVQGMAAGGPTSLGTYSDGGRMIKGPGDGMSDSVPASINGRRPARLTDGEFVVPADVVSHLGNGSTDAGARQLYAMMDRVRKARTGRTRQGREINPQKALPA